jgi:dTDP-4-dehydrorhamnose reductase
MSNKPTLLVTGGSGYLGRHLTPRAAETCLVYATYGTDPERIKAGIPESLDVTSRRDVLDLIARLSPRAIIHCAAANPGSDEGMMMQVNAAGSRYVAEGAAAVGARLVHVSSDTVHDGQHAPYDDEAPSAPINLYGRSKAAAEAAVAEVYPAAAIVRTSLIYGLYEMDRGTSGFAERLKAGRPLFLFRDVLRQPVWTESLVTALLKLAFEVMDFAGILNVVGNQELSRETFGRRMLEWWQVEERHLARSGLAADLPHPPPLDLRLTTAKAEKVLRMSFPGVDDVLTRASQARKS